MALVPVTGEVLDLDSPSEVLVDALHRITDLQSQLAAARRDLGFEITRRMDADNLRQVDVDGFRVTVRKPDEKWDLERLDLVLDELVAAGVITRSAVDRLFRVKREVQAREMTKLLGNLGADEQSAVRDCCRVAHARMPSVKDQSKEYRGWSR